MTTGRKTTVGCPHCGHRLSGQEGTCPQCGHATTTDLRYKCPYCGTLVLSSYETCPTCDSKLPRVAKRPESKRKGQQKKPAKGKAVARASDDDMAREKEPKADLPAEDLAECPVCGAEVTATAPRCDRCGAEFEPESEHPAEAPLPDTVLADCPVCGTSVPLSVNTCPKCGAEFTLIEAGEGSVLEAEPVQSAGAGAEDQAECPVCGSMADISAKSCQFCGAEFEPEEATPDGLDTPPEVRSDSTEASDEDVSCPECGHAVGPTVEACPHCGAEFEPEEEYPEIQPEPQEITAQTGEDEILCPLCRNPVGAVVAVCPHCGVEFEGDEGVDAKTAVGRRKDRGRAKPSALGILRPWARSPRGRQKGISNGESAINGVSLVNGRGQAARTSRINGLGATNGSGLINGRGRVTATGRINGRGATNGVDLINGRGLSNGGAVNGMGYGPRGRRGKVLLRWQLLVIIIVAALAIPAVIFVTIDRDGSPFTVDGRFGDWDGETKLTTVSAADSPSINVVEWSVAVHAGVLYLYLETENPSMAGDVGEGFVLFLDSDGSADTGYLLAELGADAMLELQGWNGSVAVSLLSVFTSSEDRLDWNAWSTRAGAACSFGGSCLEASAKLPVTVGNGSKVMLVSFDEDGPGSRSLPTPLEGGLLVIEHVPSADVSSDGILEIGPDVVVSSLRFTCIRSGGTVDSVSPGLVGLELIEQVGSFSLQPGDETVIELRTDASSLPSGQFVSVDVTAEDVHSSFAMVHVQGLGTRAYVDAPPSEVAIDGAFADWDGRIVADVDVVAVKNPNIDIAEVGGANDTAKSYFFVSVEGEMCMGSYVPETCSRPTSAGNGSAIQVRRTAEDFIRVYIDCDESAITGLRVSTGPVTIGADYLIVVTGMYRQIRQTVLSAYEGADWIEVAALVDVEIDESRMEIGVDTDLIDSSGDLDFIVISTDWRKAEDIAVYVAAGGTGSRVLNPLDFPFSYPGPLTESLPEFGDVAIPVVSVLVMFIFLARRRRESHTSDEESSSPGSDNQPEDVTCLRQSSH